MGNMNSGFFFLLEKLSFNKENLLNIPSHNLWFAVDRNFTIWLVQYPWEYFDKNNLLSPKAEFFCTLFVVYLYVLNLMRTNPIGNWHWQYFDWLSNISCWLATSHPADVAQKSQDERQLTSLLNHNFIFKYVMWANNPSRQFNHKNLEHKI